MMERRRALMGAGKQELVDTSITETGFYVRKNSTETRISGCRKQGTIKVWYDKNTSTANFASSSWTNGLASTNYANPAQFKYSSTRCKFGGSGTNPAETPRGDFDMDSAYAFWVETGRIMFAGKNTPYYGMSNIDGTLAEPGWSG